MKSLQIFMKESLEDILEGFNNLKVYCVGRGEGPVVICKDFPTKDPYNSDSNKRFDIRKTDWLFDDITNGTGNLAVIVWNDERIYGYILNDVKNEKDLRKEFDKLAKEFIDEFGDTFEDVYLHLPCGAAVDLGGDGSTCTVDSLWKAWMDQFNNSEVDGDSSNCRCLVDLKKKQVLAGGSDITFEI